MNSKLVTLQAFPMFLSLFSIGFSSLMGFATHHFYVSKTIMNYTPDKGAVEVTMRFFTDDLEKAMGVFTSSDFKVNASDIAASQLVADYVERHFRASVNGKAVHCSWVGMEAEADLTYCYLEISVGEPIQTIEVVNHALMEVFPEQQNIVDFSALSTTQTAILVKGSSQHTFSR